MIAEFQASDRAARGRHEAALSLLDILVLTPRNGEGDALIRSIQRTRAKVRHCWPMPDIIAEDADIVVTELDATLSRRLPWVPGQSKAALVVLLPGGAVPLEALHNCAPDALLARPFSEVAVPATLLQGHTRFTYEKRLRARIEKLDETLRGVRVIERAKAILVHTRKIGEDDAYNFIRRQAMDRRVTINMVANAIIDSHQLLG